jgi:hypothetical protein
MKPGRSDEEPADDRPQREFERRRARRLDDPDHEEDDAEDECDLCGRQYADGEARSVRGDVWIGWS